MEILLLREKKKWWTIIIWVFISIVKISKSQDFRIDNQLRIQANDCYTRIAIGSRMPENSVISTVTANSLSDCETACSANRTVCNAFSFGIDSRGNGTCRIGRMDLNTQGKDLVMDSEYDVYERRAKMPRGCQHDRLLRIGYGVEMTIKNSSISNNTDLRRQRMNTQENNGRPMMVVVRRPQNPFGNPFPTRDMSGINSPREPSFFRGGWYSPIADDGDSRLYDIINNKKNYPWKQTHNNEESPLHYQEVHHQGLHLYSGLHEAEHDYGYPEKTSRGYGVDNKWSSGLHGGNSEWTEESLKFNPQWTKPSPEVNSKWIESTSAIDTRWNQRNSGVNEKWTERNAGLNTKWPGSSQVLNSKLSRGSQVWKPKWTRSNQGLNSKWTAINPELNLKWTASSPVSNTKWTEINSDLNPKWTEINPELNPKWTKAYAEFGLKLNPTRLEVTPREILFSTSTTAPGFVTHIQEFPTAATVDPVLEKTKRK